MNLTQLIPILDGSDTSPRAGAMRGLLAMAESGYRFAVRRRNRAFDCGKRSSAALGRATISVGNITTGGTGKTPIVIDLARRLANLGHTPGVLLRGYHGQDETLELRNALAGTADVEANPDRVQGAAALLKRSPQTQVLLLDDGFQHRQVKRHLDLVLIDAMRPFGFEHLLPRGLLREPIANLRRADAVIVTRCDRVPDEQLQVLDDRIADFTGSPPLAHTAHRWSALREGEQGRAIEDLKSMRVVGVCGIGNPDAFEQTLAQHAGRVQGFASFADHHPYTRDELIELLTQAKRDFADAVVTTEKDYVKWKPLLAGETLPLPVLRPELTITYVQGEAALEARLRKAVARPDATTSR